MKVVFVSTMFRRHVVPAGLLAFSIALGGRVLGAQSPRRNADSISTDSTRLRRLDPVVVTAARVDAPLTTSAAAVTRLSGEALRKLPVKTVADALQYVPGMLVL